MSKYQGKYRIESNRIKEWNYSATGYHFVTICTKNKINSLGVIQNGIYLPNENAEILEAEIKNTEIIRPNVDIIEYQLMPNHVHLIVSIFNEFPVANSQKNSLGTIVSQIKSMTTKKIRKAGDIYFEWQTNYYDRIIRDEEELKNIRTYIQQNLLKWEMDKYHKL